MTSSSGCSRATCSWRTFSTSWARCSTYFTSLGQTASFPLPNSIKSGTICTAYLYGVRQGPESSTNHTCLHFSGDQSGLYPKSNRVPQFTGIKVCMRTGCMPSTRPRGCWTTDSKPTEFLHSEIINILLWCFHYGSLPNILPPKLLPNSQTTLPTIVLSLSMWFSRNLVGGRHVCQVRRGAAAGAAVPDAHRHHPRWRARRRAGALAVCLPPSRWIRAHAIAIEQRRCRAAAESVLGHHHRRRA